jgi:hypothetical protein
MTNMILPGSKYANKLSRTYPKTLKPNVTSDPTVHISQQPAGNWTIQINGGQEFPATIAEVALHKRVVELEAELKAMKTRLRG